MGTRFELPEWTPEEVRTFATARMVVLVLDVEVCNPANASVVAIGTVLCAYHDVFTYQKIQQRQFVVHRKEAEFLPAVLQFWKNRAPEALDYFLTTRAATLPEVAARNFSAYLNHCRRSAPRLLLVIDDPVNDCAILNQFLLQHHQPSFNADERGSYFRATYVSRCLLRGAFSMVCEDFTNLLISDLNLAITNCWSALAEKLKVDPRRVWRSIISKAPDGDCASSRDLEDADPGPLVKHMPVVDALGTARLLFYMEDIKFYFFESMRKHGIQTAKSNPLTI